MIRAGQHLGSISSTCARWATVALVFAVFLLLMLVGCSRTHIAKVVSEKWDVGQHQRCFYGQAATSACHCAFKNYRLQGRWCNRFKGRRGITRL